MGLWTKGSSCCPLFSLARMQLCPQRSTHVQGQG